MVNPKGMEKERCLAIILAAGWGVRMQAPLPKQYMTLQGKPILYYTLRQFQKSKIIDEIVLVVGEKEIGAVQKEIVDRYHFTKVSGIVPGGRERYLSVWNGLQWLAQHKTEATYLFIHDGVRPFVGEAILQRAYETVKESKACVAGMPVKDTVKLVDETGVVLDTPKREEVWQIQTPQVFEKTLVVEAYTRFLAQSTGAVTDDASVVEQMLQVPVQVFEGAYENIKITTPEDLLIAETFLTR